MESMKYYLISINIVRENDLCRRNHGKEDFIIIVRPSEIKVAQPLTAFSNNQSQHQIDQYIHKTALNYMYLESLVCEFPITATDRNVLFNFRV